MEKEEKKDFNEYRFKGLNYERISNNYITANRVSENETKIIVKVAGEHLIKTAYGYALILDYSRVVFLKEWQVSINFYGNEVVLDKNYFKVKEWGEHDMFTTDDNECKWETWLQVAKEQQEANNTVKWLDGQKSVKEYWNKVLYGA